MLLTSSQVSVAISSIIVFLFTTALFLSGYVLQQQTVRDLRAAIKPQLVRPAPGGPELYLPPQFREDGFLVDKVEVAQTQSNDDGKQQKSTQTEEQKEISDNGEGNVKVDGEDDMVGATRWQKAARKKMLEENAENGQKPIHHQSSQEGGKETEKTKEQKAEDKISRAERRRRIKEQILAEGEGEGFKGYRRRMW